MNTVEKKGQVLAYLRVSTAKQNLDRQESLKDGADKVFLEKASAKTKDRPQLQQLLDYARDGDTIRVWSIDRLARSMADLVELVGALTEKGVTVEFLKEGLTFRGDDKNALSSYDKLLFHLLGAIAQFERELMLERQAEGIEKAKQVGKYKGRKRVLTDAIAREAKERHENGVTIARLCRDYEVGRTTLWKEMKAVEGKVSAPTE